MTNVPDSTGSVPSPADIPPVLNSKSGFGSQFLTLASGFTAVPVPVNVVGLVLIPPSGNATSIVLKGITGDTGLSLAPNGVNYITIASSVTTIGLTCGAQIVGVELIWQ